MNRKVSITIIALALICAGVAIGVMAGIASTDTPAEGEDDGPVTWWVVKQREPYNGKIGIQVAFSENPVEYTVVYEGQVLTDGHGTKTLFTVDPVTLQTSLWLTMPPGVSAEELVNGLETRSVYVDLVRVPAP